MGYGHSGVGNIKVKVYFVGKCSVHRVQASYVCHLH